ncbi:MAG: hypothetical protein ACKVY0_09310 [Prosthecobacter sp.]|uniref:hypothetical protein n=1 Tax=Prosthecobacter sp. TaxID=1965333 RepID=UPI0038FE736F
MNTTNSSSKTRFIQNLAETPVFHSHQEAFNALTGLTLNLRLAQENEHDQTDLRTLRHDGLTLAHIPVKIGKNVIAIIETSPVRLIPPGDEAFHTVARTMLDQNRTAADIRAAKARFDRHPMLDAARYDAALIVARSFAAQLGEAAHRTLFAHTTAEPEGVHRRNDVLYRQSRVGLLF